MTELEAVHKYVDTIEKLLGVQMAALNELRAALRPLPEDHETTV